MKKKILNNVIGLGYNPNLINLKDFLKKHPNCAGFHHVANQIAVCENTYKLPYNSNIDINNNISIIPLKEKIIQGKL
jgi:hypothetical protein